MNPNRRPTESFGIKLIERLHEMSLDRVLLLGGNVMCRKYFLQVIFNVSGSVSGSLGTNYHVYHNKIG